MSASVVCKKLTIVCVCLVISILTCNSGWAGEQKVTAYLAKKVTIFQPKGESFKRTGRIPADEMPALPAVIQEVSSKGYVMIMAEDGPVWLDPMDVDIKPRKRTSKSRKKEKVSGSSSRKGFHTRGIGE